MYNVSAGNVSAGNVSARNYTFHSSVRFSKCDWPATCGINTTLLYACLYTAAVLAIRLYEVLCSTAFRKWSSKLSIPFGSNTKCYITITGLEFENFLRTVNFGTVYSLFFRTS